MFSGLRDKLAEGVREFEASLAAPLPASPSRSSAAPALPRPTPSPSPSRAPAPAPAPASASSSPSRGVGQGEQTASQLADSALSSLRMSFKKGRASIDSARSRASVDSVRSPRSPTAQVVPPPLPNPVVDEPAPAPPPPPPPTPTPPPASESIPAHPPPQAPPTINEPTPPAPRVDMLAPASPDPGDEWGLDDGGLDADVEPAEELEPERGVQEPTVSEDEPIPDPAPAPVDEPGLVKLAPESLDEPAREPEWEPTLEPVLGPVLEPEPVVDSAGVSEERELALVVVVEPASASAELKPEPEPPVIAEVVQALAPEPVVEAPVIETSPPAAEPLPTATELIVEPSPVEEPAPAIEELALVPEAATIAPVEPTALPSSIKPISVVELSGAVPDDIQTDYLKLKALKASLDRIVGDTTALGSVDDVDAFEGELRNLVGKSSMSMAEVGRLTAQLAQQKSRTDELRDTHRLEVASQSSTIDALRAELSTSQSSLALSTDSLTEARSALSTAATDYAKLQIVAKEEEEKRTKALSLLRALRTKLRAAESDKDELALELATLKSSETTLQETSRADRARFDSEVVSLRAAHELQLSKLRGSFDREASALKAQREREAAARKAASELALITANAAAAKEASVQAARISQLERTVRELEEARTGVFGELQVRTEEAEGAKEREQAHEASEQERQYELKESRDRIAALQDEVDELRRSSVGRESAGSSSQTRRLLVEAEARHEAKVRDLEARARQLEKDRLEAEDEMSRNLQDRLREVERMRQTIVQKDIDYAQSVHERVGREKRIEEGDKERRELVAKLKGMEGVLGDLKEDAAKYAKAEIAVREELNDRLQRASSLEQRLEEVQTKESSLRSNNKVLRDELRKLQSGVLQSEKQRHPGVGYFASYSQSGSTPLSPNSEGGTLSRSDSSSTLGSLSGPTTNGASAMQGDEALNFEYLRNVILQFLERPEMRPHLVSVLGVILHFTPAESRRLAAKAI